MDKQIEMVTCIHCKHTMEWEGSDDVTGAVPYCCENCGEIFCTACVPISEEDEHVLCKNCKNKLNKRRFIMKETTVEELRAMNYSEFCEWGDENFDKIEYILSYEDFSVVKYQDCYFFYEHRTEMSSEDFYEVKIIAQLDYDINHDLKAKDGDTLHELFDCDVCGEYVHDKGISYLWFKEKE